MTASSADLLARSPAQPTDVARPSARPRWVGVAGAVAILGAVFWIGAVALSLGRGFDASDEGLYLLSYRWWDTDFYTFTGAQFVYGPVFDLLGQNIAALRGFRLATVVGVHTVFGWVFMGWLRRRRRTAPPTRWWEVGGTAAIVAAGGMTYSWIPLTPGYNDLSTLGALLAATVVLRLAIQVDRGSPIRPWLPAFLGSIAVFVLLARWPSAVVTFAVVGVSGAVILAPRGARQVFRAAGWALAGAAATLLLVQLLVVPLTTAVPELFSATRNATSGGQSVTAILQGYGRSTVDVAAAVVWGHGLLLVAVLVAALARSTRGRVAAGILTVAGLGGSAVRVVVDGNLRGGAVNVTHFPIGLLALAGIAGVLGLVVVFDRRSGGSSLRRDGRQGVVILLLAVLPAAQAFGTNNPLYQVAILGFGATVAAMLAVVTGLESAPRTARRVAVVAVAAAVVMPVAIAVNAIWFHAYRVGPRSSNTDVVASVPALASVTVEPALARRWSILRDLLRPYLEPDGRAIMAFDEMPGVVFLLGGRSVGEQWYAAADPSRTARGIRAVCEAGRVWWGSRSPVLIFGREASPTEVAALRSCGLSLETDYRGLPPRPELNGLTVYVPTAG